MLRLYSCSYLLLLVSFSTSCQWALWILSYLASHSRLSAHTVIRGENAWHDGSFDWKAAPPVSSCSLDQCTYGTPLLAGCPVHTELVPFHMVQHTTRSRPLAECTEVPVHLIAEMVRRIKKVES